MSQERMESPGGSVQRSETTHTPRSNAISYSDGVEGALSRASEAMKKVRVVHGANDMYENIEGKTVGWVRKRYREILNIPSDAEAFVAGKVVNDDFILEGASQLEFLKESGVKGFFVI